MARKNRKKLKPPARGGGRNRRRSSANTGWFVLLGLVVVLGVVGIVSSRDGGRGSGIVEELVVPDLTEAQTIAVTRVLKQPYDRIAEGDDLFELSADDEARMVSAPSDGFLVGLAVAEGDTVDPGAVLGTVQSGPDFSTTNAAGHHWHTAYGVNICGSWLGQLGETPGDFHTHGDGIIHAHPLSTAAAGSNAKLGLWFERMGGRVTRTELRYPGDQTYRSADVDCDGEPGVLRWALNGEEQDGDPSDLVVGNGDVLVIAFVPEDAELPTLAPSTGFMAENYAVPKHPDFAPPPPPQPEAGDGADATPTTDAAGEGE